MGGHFPHLENSRGALGRFSSVRTPCGRPRSPTLPLPAAELGLGPGHRAATPAFCLCLPDRYAPENLNTVPLPLACGCPRACSPHPSTSRQRPRPATSPSGQVSLEGLGRNLCTGLGAVFPAWWPLTSLLVETSPEHVHGTPAHLVLPRLVPHGKRRLLDSKHRVSHQATES